MYTIINCTKPTNISAGISKQVYGNYKTHTDVLGYVPNDSGIELQGDPTLDPSNLIRFAKTFDVDTNGVNLVVPANEYGDDRQNVCVQKHRWALHLQTNYNDH